MSEKTYSTRGPICPHCDHEHLDLEAFHYDEDLDEMECDCCEEVFAVRVYHSVSWTCSHPAQPEQKEGGE